MTSDLKKIAALWAKEGKSGTFLSGAWDKKAELPFPEGSRILIFKVREKKNERGPDYEMFLSPPRVDQSANIEALKEIVLEDKEDLPF